MSGTPSTAAQLQAAQKQREQAEAEVAKLRQKRVEEIQAEISANESRTAALQTELASLTGEPVAAPKVRTRKPRAKGKPSGGGRTKGTVTLAEAIETVLKGKKDGMAIKDLATAVLKVKGFKTESKDLSPLIAQALRKDGAPFRKVSRGVYAVKGGK